MLCSQRGHRVLPMPCSQTPLGPEPLPAQGAVPFASRWQGVHPFFFFLADSNRMLSVASSPTQVTKKGLSAQSRVVTCLFLAHSVVAPSEIPAPSLPTPLRLLVLHRFLRQPFTNSLSVCISRCEWPLPGRLPRWCTRPPPTGGCCQLQLPQLWKVTVTLPAGSLLAESRTALSWREPPPMTG